MLTHMRSAGLFVVLSMVAGFAACSDDAAGPDVGLDGTVGSDLGADTKAPADAAPTFDPQLTHLASWMTGSFSSADQAKKDLAFYHVTLDMKRIWPQQTDGYWLYVEQAIAGSLPYRQRIYRLRIEGTSFTSTVFEFSSKAEADKAVGAHKQAQPLAQLTEKDLVEKPGCGVTLSWDAKTKVYSGATKPKACLTTYNGATYTTSDVQLSSDKMSSWDRGYDSSDKQVWGAVKGPYIFDKLQDLDPELAL